MGTFLWKISKTLDGRNWPDTGCSRRQQLPGPLRTEAAEHHGRSPSQSRAQAFLLHEDLLERASGSTQQHRQPPALEPGSPWRQLEKGSWAHPLCCFQGLRKYRPVFQLPPLARRPPVLSSGAALGPVLACDHLMDVPGSQGPDGSIPSCSPSPTPAARQLGPLGLWGRFHRKGPALCDCRVFSVKPPTPSANPCVLLSPEQNVNQRLKTKGIEYLSYP